MSRVALGQIPLVANRFAGWGRILHRILFGLFLIQLLLVVARLWLPAPPFGAARWPDGLLVVLATAATLSALGQQLPGQNVMLVSLLIAFIGGAVHTLGARTFIPFGPFGYTENVGQKLFEPLPWAVPMLWIVAILTSRGAARLMLRPWRKAPTYGFRLIGLTVLLVALFDVGLEPFATSVKHYWIWQPTKLPLTWYGAPIVNFLGWAVTALLILAFTTPALLNKKPVKHPPDYYPLLIWVLLNLVFVAGAAAFRLWPAVVVVLAQSVLVTVFAVRGARW